MASAITRAGLPLGTLDAAAIGCPRSEAPLAGVLSHVVKTLERVLVSRVPKPPGPARRTAGGGCSHIAVVYVSIFLQAVSGAAF